MDAIGTPTFPNKRPAWPKLKERRTKAGTPVLAGHDGAVCFGPIAELEAMSQQPFPEYEGPDVHLSYPLARHYVGAKPPDAILPSKTALWRFGEWGLFVAPRVEGEDKPVPAKGRF